MKKTFLLAMLMLLISLGAHAGQKAFVIGVQGADDSLIENWRENTQAVENALIAGGYDTQAAYDPEFGYSFPDLDRFLAGVDSGDEVLIYYTGPFASAYSSLFLLPSGFDAASDKLPLDSYNIQRVLNRLWMQEASTVLILDLFPHPDWISDTQNDIPSLILSNVNPVNQIVMANVNDPTFKIFNGEVDLFPSTLAEYLHDGLILNFEVLNWLSHEITDLADGTISPQVQYRGPIEIKGSLYKMYAPTKAFESIDNPQKIIIPVGGTAVPGVSAPAPEPDDGGGSYSF